jgi:Kelch motif protein
MNFQSFPARLASIAVAVNLTLAVSTPVFAGTSGTWSNTGAMNVARYQHTATLLSNGEVLVTGGVNSTGYLSSVEVYNPSTGKWTLTANMSIPRTGHDAVLLQNGQVLVAGGYNASTPNCTFLATAELYNPSTGLWTEAGAMTAGRADFTLTVLSNGQVLAAGGDNCGGGGLTSAELYNPATGAWTATGSMTLGNQSNDAVLLSNGEVFVIGNHNIFNPSMGTWTATTAPPITANPPIALLQNGSLWVAGQSIQGDLIYNTSTAQWTTLSPPPCTIGGQTPQNCQSGGVLLKTGKILVAGGFTFVNGQPYPTEETNKISTLLDPSSLTWTSTGSMTISTISQSMTVLTNGQVLAAGGETFSKKSGTLVPIAVAEQYSP